MKFPGAILMGAHTRLLPPDIPFRFFAAALTFHIVLWSVLASAADQVASFEGGPGPVLAAVHLLTLGVLVMVVMGASYQILPVVTGRPLLAIWPCKLSFWSYVVGIAGLVWGMASGDTTAMIAAGALVGLALLIYGGLVASILIGLDFLTLLRTYLWGALVCLVVITVLGVLVTYDYQDAVLPDRSAIGLSHMILAVFGFMGLTAFGFSYVLVPMFALSSAPSVKKGLIVFACGVAALILALLGALLGSEAWLLACLAPALAAAILHIVGLGQLMRKGMKKNLGLSFVLVRCAWAMLLASIIIGGLGVAGVLGDIGLALFGALALLGWLLTFLMGILQRIIPFLAAMNTSLDGAPPRLSELSSETPLKVHALFHFAAVALVLGGIILDAEMLIRFGAFGGVAGGLAFSWFALNVYRHMRQVKARQSDLS